MITRSKTRLAKAEKKHNEVETNKTYDSPVQETDCEHIESEQENSAPPPRKRPRATTTKSIKVVAREKHVQGKQGRLAGLADIPFDIITEVASHLLPGDIISLSRLNKFFRDLLMHRSAIHIWHGSMKNVAGLPTCPRGMCEPHYLSLLFSKTCSMCGKATKDQMDTLLLARLCGSCRNADLIPLDTASTELQLLVPSSRNALPSRHCPSGSFVLRKEYDEIATEYANIRASHDSGALEAWVKKKSKKMKKRQKQCRRLVKFFTAQELDRERELEDIKMARDSEIKRRLLEMGWTKKDMKFPRWSDDQPVWDDLVLQPKPLTNQAWAKIQPRLVLLLEANRERRLTREREVRRHARRVRLAELMLDIRRESYPALQFKVQCPAPSAWSPIINVSQEIPFPYLVYALDWPILETLDTTDLTVEEMEASFEEHREEIEALIAKWSNKIQNHFLQQLRDGSDVQGKILLPTTIVCDDGSDPFANVSDDLKRILRADSLFYKTTTRSTLKRPMSYNSMLSLEGLVASRVAFCQASSPKLTNLDHIRLHPEAQEVARAILVEMGRPDASYIEMKGVGSNFVCGRCHITDHVTWEQLIKHYIKQNQLYDSIHKDQPSPANLGITYNNVHDITLRTNQPMAKYFSSKGVNKPEGNGCRQVCKLCEGIPAICGVAGFKPVILQHLRDVHGITKPKVNEHYAPRAYSLGWSEAHEYPSYYSDGGYSDHSGDHDWGRRSSDNDPAFDVDYESEYSGCEDEDMGLDGEYWFDSEDDEAWSPIEDDSTLPDSARLAKKKGVAGAGQMHGNGEDSTYFEHEKPEQEETHQSPQKRQRSTKKPTGGVIRKKVRGKQGRLADLVNMPIDIFTEVASYLLPSDIISLARSNKFFRNMLMHRSAIHIWHSTMKNVTGLPACPPGMSEPHYLALLFSKTCSMCGDPVRAAMDTVLLVRLCGPCRNTHLMPRRVVPLVIVPQVHFTLNSAPETSYPFNVYALREDVSSLLDEYREKACSNDETALDSWAKERNNIKTARLVQAAVLDEFLLALEQNRKQEIEDIKATRQSEVKRRLAEMGWTEKDMEFCRWSRSYHENRRTWDNLVMQPKPLTDRIWTNIKPKLIIILETNRKVHLDMQRNLRTQNRRDSLSKLFFDLKKGSVLNFKVPNPVPWLSSSIPTISFVYRSPFPDFFHILHWPLVKDLYETDSTVEEMETRFEEKREEIEGLVSEWRNRFQSQLVGQVSDGYTSQGETLRPTIAVSNDNHEAFAKVSDDLKLLLRADSLFRKATPPDLQQPSSYGTALTTEGLFGSHPIFEPVPSRAAPNLDHIHWYPEAHEAARELLADMGIPDASYLEMESLGSVFACGRCYETDDRDWEGIVQHYVEQKQLCTKVQEEIARFDSRITYNNLHDPTLLVDQPLVVDHAVKILESIFQAEISGLQVCRVCKKIPVAGQFIALEPDILKHLLDVHGIAEPKVDEHYSPKAIGPGLSGKGNYDSGDNHHMFAEGDIAVHVEDVLEYKYAS